MNYKVTAMAGLLVSAPAMAGVINHNGMSYETVSWTSLSTETNTATGTAGSVNFTFSISEGNLLDNALVPNYQVGGSIEVTGTNLTSLLWDQSTNGGSDQMLISFAIATVPAPSTAIALMVPGLLAGRRRR